MKTRQTTIRSLARSAAAAILVVSGLAPTAGAQTIFNRYYNSSGGSGEIASSIEQTSDRGYIMLGVRTINPTTGAFYAVKTTSQGQVSWAKSYSVAGAGLRGSCVRQTRDGGYIMAGTCDNQGLGPEKQIVLIKTDASGNVSWAWAYRGGNSISSVYRGAMVREVAGAGGGYAVVSNVYLPTQNNINAGILLRVGPSGNTIDEDYYTDPRHPGFGATMFRDIRQDVNGSLVIVGSTYDASSSPAANEALLFKTQPNSSAVSGVLAYGPPVANCTGESLEITAGGAGYAFMGHYGASTNTILCKTTTNLTPLFTKWFAGLDTAYSLRENPWYELVSTGFSPNASFPSFNASTLMKTTASGTFQWAWQYPTGGEQYAVQGVPTADGGYMLTGASVNGPNAFNFSAIKTSATADGCGQTFVTPNMPGLALSISSITLTRTQYGGASTFSPTVTPDQPATDYTCLSAGCTPPPAGMVFWAPFDSVLSYRDIASGANATSTGGEMLTSGKVGTAFCFGAANNPYIDFPSTASMNFQTGDFSFDAWVRRPNNGGPPLDDGVRVIADKRTAYTDGSIRGYTFYLYNGQIACQVASGPAINYGSGVVGTVPADGQWHLVAVTIRRNGPNPEILFYRDGQQVGLSVPVSPGNLGLSVNCASVLRIGARVAAGSVAGSNFNECIDEVELFNRALTPAEVNSLYLAQSSGKCREFTSLPVVSMCPLSTQITATAYICNYTNSPKSYTFTLQGLPVGPGTNIVGPSFPPSTAYNASFNPGVCGPVSITIPRPLGLGNGLIGGWQMCVQSSSGAAFCGTSTVVGASYLCIPNPNPSGYAAQSGVPINIALVASNDGPTAMNAPLRIRAIGPDMEPDTTAIKLNGLPPGEPVFGTLSIAPGGSSPITFSAEIAPGGEDGMYRLHTILIEADLDGDGQYEPVSAVAVNDETPPPPPPCRADINLDGEITSQDFFDFLARFFSGNMEADVNHDGVITSQDFFDFLAAFFSGC